MNNNTNRYDCLDHVRYKISWSSSEIIHCKDSTFESNHHFQDTFILGYGPFKQIYNLYKRKEIRAVKDHYINFAKKCMWQSSPGQCILSLRAGYKPKLKECVLTFKVEDCYFVSKIHEKYGNGFIVKSNEPVIVWELGDCVEAKICRATLKRIESAAIKVFDFQ